MDTLGDLLDWWLEVRCPCGQTTYMPINLMARRFGAGARLPNLTPRLICSQCGRRPTDLRLLDRTNGEALGSSYPPASERPIR